MPTRTSVQYPDGQVLLRNLKRRYPVVARGEGLYLFDEDGRRYIDASGGALVVSLGHGNREISDRLAEQLGRVSYVSGMQFTSEPTEELARRLIARAPQGIGRASFLCSGSEAVEAAIKFARQLWMERGQERRAKIIARSPGYHGNTLFALSASARPAYRKFYGPLLSDVVMIPAPYEYRSPVDYARDGGAYFADALEQAIRKEGPDTIAAFIFEPVIGSSAGASVPPPGYFDRVQEICRRYGILMIADEVMCGSGRTGKFFACENFCLEPDIIVLGKGLNSGYAPLSAVLTREDHVREMKRGSGGFMHAQTYMQVPGTTAAGVAVLDYMERHDVLANATRVGEYFQRRLREVIAPLPRVGHVGGMGLIAGVEFVDDKSTKKPPTGSKAFLDRFVEAAFEKGLLLWPNVGQADGIEGALVMLGPPLTIRNDQADEIVDRLREVIACF
jgi:adenosylmethionine-8-amino-7-oxononanoate aminotransferase